MYIVYYWRYCRIIGKYLDKMIFDNYNNAKCFARQHNSKIERKIIC